MNNDFFSFENTKLDFPFYTNNPKLSKSSWAGLILSIILGYFLLSVSYVGPVLMCAVMLVAVLYCLKWDYKRIFQKPSLNDIGWAVVMVFAYMAYATVMEHLLTYHGVNEAYDVVVNRVFDAIFTLIFQMMGEELIKFILFVFFLYIIYKYTQKRKISIVLSVFTTLIIFGSMHAIGISLLISILVQGIGSVFHIFLYVKSKNLMISYISHFLTDAIATVMILMSAG